MHFTARRLWKSPGFTLVAIALLALGIGANTAIFSLLDAVVLRPLPVRSPSQLVVLSANQGREFPFPLLDVFRSEVPAFSGVLGRCPLGFRFAPGAGAPAERISGELVTGGYFELLGVPALRGRTLTPGDDRKPGAHPVAVLSERFWRARFFSDPGVVGRTILLNGTPFTVVGITPGRFASTDPAYSADVRVPMMMQQVFLTEGDLLHSPAPWVQMVGRLAPGASLTSAASAANVQYKRWAKAAAMPAGLRRYLSEQGVALLPGSRGASFFREQHRKALWMLMAGVAALLLLACANLAGLMVARVAARSHETAIRMSLGAGRWRIARQLLAESVVLSTAGAAAGLLVSLWATRALIAWLPQGRTPLAIDAAVNMRVLGFTAALALAAGVLCALAPALQIMHAGIHAALRGGRGELNGGNRGSLRQALAAAQVALSIMLLVGAGLLGRTLRNLVQVDPGFRAANVVTASLEPGLSKYTREQSEALAGRVLERVRGLPGVRSASIACVPLMAGAGGHGFRIAVEGHPEAATGGVRMDWNCVSPGYFAGLGIPVLDGRDFTSADGARSGKVAVVSRSFARRFWGQTSAVGRRLGAPGGPLDIEVVGEVADSKFHDLREPSPLMVYQPLAQRPRLFTLNFMIRSAGSAAAAVPAVRRAIREADANVPLSRISTLEAEVGNSLSRERLMAALAGAFALLAAALAGIGLYGMVAGRVGRRTREIGVRVALGAPRTSILKLVLRQQFAPVIIGIAAGLGAAAAGTRLVSSLLFGVAPHDPATYAAAVLLLGAIAAAAALAPALRAMRIDPVAALRQE